MTPNKRAEAAEKRRKEQQAKGKKPTVTSSGNRGKRAESSKATVRTDKGRGNRQSASTAKVTNSAGRTSTGSAKVTGGQKALPPGQKGGPVGSKSGKGGGTTPPIQRVTVRDLGNKQSDRLPGSSTKSLPPGRQGGAMQSPRSGAKPGTAPKGSPAGGLRGGLAGAAVYSLANAALEPLARQAGTKLGNAIKTSFDGQKAKDRKETAKSKNRRAGGTSKPPVKPKPGNMSAYLSWKASQDAKKPEQKSANDGQASRRDSQRQQAGGTARAAAPAKQSTVRPSQAETRTPATGTAGKGQKWEDFNKGRGTSKTNNPLITKDEWLMSKIKGRESPVEKKEEEDKKKKKKQSAANAAGWDGNKNY
jgi:hypothetical protein